MWLTKKINIFLPRLTAYKQQKYIPTKTYGVETTEIYSYQDLRRTNNSNIFLPRLMAYKQQEYIATKTYGVQTTGIYSCQYLWRTDSRNIFLLFVRHKSWQEYIALFVRHKSWYSVVNLGRCSLFPSSVGLRTYQHHGSCCVSRTCGSTAKVSGVVLSQQQYVSVRGICGTGQRLTEHEFWRFTFVRGTRRSPTAPPRHLTYLTKT